ncbi:esterase/lipase family protein [Chryseobacterium sp. MP_3.2]|uniref:esterase/lipase family protein n=1 Tax=Chryseobacterium sp. MP_3.2 TaxID=3071712 RepID=UPI002E0A9909|nr:pimeloyl-ACP methyl ester carboxylesterase [Chryseobacterium sp. MP_3.2]
MISHIKDPNSDKCIVFIHGLGGGPNTFTKFSIYLDSKWDLNYGIILFFFSFYKNIFNSKFLIVFPNFILLFLKAVWSKRNLENANKLKVYIDKNCSNSNNIVLVGHSMGGLVARQFLVNCKKDNIDIRNIRMLCTFATPHNGSQFANFLSIINKIPILKSLYLFLSKKFNYRLSPQIGDLSSLSYFLDKLNKDWRDYNLEAELDFIRIGGTKDWLVKTNSSNMHNDDLNNVFYFDYGHSQLITPLKNMKTFAPIDKFIEKINLLEIQEEYFEELEVEIDYDNEDSDENIY